MCKPVKAIEILAFTEQVTPDIVRIWVADVAAAADNEDAAHQIEDAAYQAVLRAIAEGHCEYPASCAQIVLEIRHIEFERWYA